MNSYMRRIHPLIAAAAAVLLACAGCAPQRRETTDHLNAKDIYKIILQQKFPQDTRMVVHPLSVTDSYHFPSPDRWEKRTRRLLTEKFPELKKGALDAFFRNNRRTRSIGAAALAGPKILVRESKPNGSFQTLGLQYPDALCLISFSQPAFSTDGTQAVVYCVRSAGPEKAEGRYYLLTHADEVWQIAGAILSWAY
jgi:hypothetical protein